MGCLQGKEKKKNKGDEEDREEPKTYSWDTKEKLNPSDYTIENLSNEEAGRLPGSIGGQQFIVQNCQASRIYLFDRTNTVTVDDCSDCTIFVGPTTGSLFLRDCRDCVVVAACGQFRTRDCCKVDVFLLCQTQPIIEASAKMRFGCYQAFYPQLKDHFAGAGLSIFNNYWSNVHDFTPVDGETNWSILSQKSDLSYVFKPPEGEELKGVGLQLELDLSVVPYTRGSPAYGGQDAALIIFFYDETYHQRAIEFIESLKTRVADCSVQHSRELKMEASDAQRVFQTSEHKEAVVRGPVVALLCLGSGVNEASSEIGREMNAASPSRVVYVTDEDAGGRQIDAFFSYASMSMSM